MYVGEGLENNVKSNQRWSYGQLNSKTMGVLESPQTEKEVSCEKEEPKVPPDEKASTHPSEAPISSQSPMPPLADGWEMHEDEGGLYFWHVKTGTIQREIPTALRQAPTPRLTKSSTTSQIRPSPSAVSPLSSNTHDGSTTTEQKRKSLPPPASVASPVAPLEDSQGGMQVRVKALGSIQLSEESLTNENSSRAVNRCIVQLSNHHENPETIEAGGGGPIAPEGQDLILALSEGTLKLMDPATHAVVNAQPIHTIRVWGVGRDDGRDFAYVARDKATRCHTCHVFRCEVPARAIANRLRDICKKILIERSLSQSSSKLIEAEGANGRRESASSRASSVENNTSESNAPVVSSTSGLTSLGNPTSTSAAPAAPGSSNLIRPTHFTTKLKTKTISRAPDSFPTPMEEPKKIIKAKFIGELEVSRTCTRAYLG